MNIKLPEGLEERLLSSIDRWEQAELAHKSHVRRLWYVAAVCFAVALLGSASLYIVKHDSSTSEEHTTATLLKQDDESEQVFVVHKDEAQHIVPTFVQPHKAAEFCVELEEVNVRPDPELEEINILMQPASVAMEEKDTQSGGQRYLIDPTKYDDEGVQLNEIQLKMYN